MSGVACPRCGFMSNSYGPPGLDSRDRPPEMISGDVVLCAECGGINIGVVTPFGKYMRLATLEEELRAFAHPIVREIIADLKSGRLKRDR